MHVRHLESARALVQTPRADLSYLDVGPTTAPGARDPGRAALFVHGVGTNAHLWGRAIEQLAADYRCVAVDLPLHGRSPARADQDLSIGGLADVLDEFCAALGLTSVDLVANDTGGAVAQVFAARHPERLRTFTLTNCDCHDNVPPEVFKPTVDLAKAGALAPGAAALLADPAAARAAVFAMGYEDPEYLSIDDVRGFLEPVLGTEERARRFEQMLAHLEPTALLEAEPALAALDVPTKVLWGNDDSFFETKWAYYLRDLIAGAEEVVEIDGARLFWPDERAPELVTHLRPHWDAAERTRLRAG
jgi:pimeloyl-ACP methyl ester carboxylesterase